MRSVVQRCASPDRMSRTNMALLMRVLLTASQVLTVDSKIANVEANTFDLLAVDGFQAALNALVPTACRHSQAKLFVDRGWCYYSGSSVMDGPHCSHGGVYKCGACRLDTIRLGSRRVMGHRTSPYTCGMWCLRCGAWNRWWQWPPSASERLSITLCARVGSPLWTMEGIIVATI